MWASCATAAGGHPTIHDRQGDTLYFHGSRSASMLHA